MLTLSWGLVLALSACCLQQRARVDGLNVILQSNDCSKQDVNCTIQTLRPRDDGSALWTPGRPRFVDLEWSLLRQESNASVDANRTVLTPVLNITWWLPFDDSITTLEGTEVCVTPSDENVTKCVWFVYLSTPTRLGDFSFHGFVVQPYKRYRVDVSNFPKHIPLEPDTIVTSYISLPGCEHNVMKASTQCILNGSMWSPDISVHLNESGASVTFTAVNLSTRYLVTLDGCGQIHKASVIGGIGKYKQVTFPDVAPTPGCLAIQAKIKPYFDICKDDCKERRMLLNLSDQKTTPSPPPPRNPILAKVAFAVTFCLLAFVMGLIVYCKQDSIKNQFRRAAAPAEEEKTQLPTEQLPPKLQPRRVFIVYSNDHKLFRDIVLRFAEFLQSKCGIAVSLDLLEERQVAETGRMRWLTQQLDQSSDSSAKVIVLFSRGSQMKWRALYDSTRVERREDLKSLVGDMYTPALGLICDGILRPATFEKYIVAYFEDVSGETDIPAFFRVTLKYKLMRHFKELFFRIQDEEQYRPGVTYGAQGISAHDYFEEPCGRRLLEAIETFKRFQQSNPDWFEKDEGDAGLDKAALDESSKLLSAEGVKRNVLILKPNDTCDSVTCNTANFNNDFTPVLKASLTNSSHDSGVSGIENSCSSEQTPLLCVSPATSDISENAVRSHYSNRVNINAPRASPELLLNADVPDANGSDQQQFGQISPNVLSLLEGFQRRLVSENSHSDAGDCVERPALYEPQRHVMSALQTDAGLAYYPFDRSDNNEHVDLFVPSIECPGHSIGDDRSLPYYVSPRELLDDQSSVEAILTERTMEELISLQQQVLQNSMGNL